MDELTRQRFAELKAGGLLPSPRGVALAIIEATADAETTVTDITRLVQTDPAMAGRILRYANGAHGGALRHVASLPHAVTFLGLFRVRQIALSFSLIDHYRTGDCEGFGYFSYWSGSLATAIAAQRLAYQAQSPPDESFTCGLLAGVGRLALATVFPREYSALLAEAPNGQSLVEAERRYFGIDHRQLAGEMLMDWGLPDIFAKAVSHHEQPAEAPFSPDTRAYALTASLHFAAHIARLLVLEETRRWEALPALYHAAAQVGVEAGEVPPLVEEVAASWQDWGRELQLPIRGPSDLRALFSGPSAVAGEEPPAAAVGPLQVSLAMAGSERQQRLLGTLTDLGLRVDWLPDAGQGGATLARRSPAVVIVDLGEAASESLAQVRELRSALGSAVHLIVLIAPAAEKLVAELLLAGASDYLTYDYTEPALIARLANAQQMVSLRGAIRAEWQSAINSSGTWARANRRLLHEALTDPLTQLPNRRHGLDRFGQEWSVAESNSLPLVCMMLDIDHFKQVNDRHGHEVGDLVLQQVAAAVEQSCRRNDILFRYGGEEFCCICPHASLADAVQLAERIAGRVRRGRYGLPGRGFAITLSIGVAARSAATQTPADLMACADKALYAAKEQGRDRVVACAG